jgi:Uncharacterised protein family (UPF0259)
MTARREQGEQRNREARPRPALPAGEIYQAVGRTAWRYPWRILAISVAVAALSTLVEFGVGHLVEEGNWAEELFASASLTGSSMLGSVFLSGVMVRLVGVAEHGRRDPRISTVLRALPWGSLILADLLMTLAFVVGIVLLIIPGLIVLVLFIVAGPVIEIEHRRAVAGLRRSAQLVRQRFWKVALIAGLPLVAANWLESVLPEPHGAEDIVTALIIRSVGEGVLEALIGLLLVEVCYRLIAAERGAAAALNPWSPGRSMASVAANRLPGASPATRAASCAVSTSVSSGTWRTRSRAARSRSSWAWPVCAADMGTPRISRGSGRPSPSSQNPPSAAGPNTASASPVASGSATVSSNPGVTCGVSMPISTTGTGRTAWASPNAAAIRSSSPLPRCGVTSKRPGSSARSVPGAARRSARASTCRAKDALAPASSVSASADSASVAASCGVNGGVSRVFTWPGTGALARTTSWASRAVMRPAPAACHGPHARCRTPFR